MSDSGSEEEIQRIKHNRKRRTIIDEDDDEEEDEEGLDEFEKDDFLVDDEEEPEEEEENIPVKKAKKKKRIPNSEDELDEEDLDLIKENTGLNFGSGKQKLTRLQRKGDDEYSDNEENDYYDQEGNKDGLIDMFNDDEGAVQDEEYDDYLDDFIERDLGEEEEAIQGEDPQAIMERRAALREQKSERLRKLRASGVDVEAQDIIMEIFGDGADYDYAMFDPDIIRESNKEAPQASLQAAFEPGELADRMMTEQDEVIRTMDMPERMQERFSDLLDDKPTIDEITREVDWIFTKFNDPSELEFISEGLLNKDPERIKESIKACIVFFNQEFLEVPFIWYHRRDYLIYPESKIGKILDLLSLSDVWRIYDLDWKFKLFRRQQKKFIENLDKYEAEGRVDDYVVKYAQTVDSIEDVQAMIDYINVTFINKAKESQKGNSTASFFERCKQGNLDELVEKFGLNSEKFGINVSEGINVYVTKDSLTPPIDLCKEYVSDIFPTPELVFKAVKSYIAQKFFYDLKFKKEMRQALQNGCMISTTPTSKGVMEIDTQHRFFFFKFLDKKPIFNMGHQFLSMLEAESLGLLNLEITTPRKLDFVSFLSNLYLGDQNNSNAKIWNKTREDIIEILCYEYLYPYFESWIKEKLRIRAEELLAIEVQAAIEQKIGMAPYKSPNMKDGATPRVIALSNGTGQMKDPSVAVYVNERGAVEDVIEFGDLRDEANKAILSSFFESHPTDVIVSSGFDLYIKYFMDKVKTIYSECRVSYNNSCDIFLHTDDVARIYYLLDKARKEFPKYHQVALYCISLARLLQNPLLEYAALEKDILNISFHSHQNLLPKKTFEKAIERAFINVVSNVGVDLNSVATNKRISYLVKYIPGLGPRKAQHLIKRVKESDKFESRAELVTKKAVTKNVFINCAAFFKISQPSEILDSTRIHPEDYGLARKMSADALEVEEDYMDDYDHPSKNVVELMKKQSHRVNDLDLADYSRLLALTYGSLKTATLTLIKSEIASPFGEIRAPFKPATLDLLLTQLTGETPDTLNPQMVIPAEITKVLPKIILCKLNSGLDGVISMRNVYSKDSIEQGDIVQAAVLSVNLERFQVDLSLREEDIRGCQQRAKEYFGRNGPGVDKYFAQQLFEKELADHPEIYPNMPKQSRQMNRNPNVKAIMHPLYKDFTFKEAEDYLSSRQRGEVLLRPSSQGSNNIAVSWKFYDGVIQHLNVQEESHPDFHNAPPRLRLGNYSYADLDELLVTHIEGSKQRVDEIVNHPKFHRGNQTSLEEYVTTSTLSNPQKAFYAFCVADRNPGYIYIGFKLNGKSPYMMWPIKVEPKSFILNKVSYPDITALLNGFKLMATNFSIRGNQNPQHAYPPHSQHTQGYRPDIRPPRPMQRPPAMYPGMQPPRHPRPIPHIQGHRPPYAPPQHMQGVRPPYGVPPPYAGQMHIPSGQPQGPGQAYNPHGQAYNPNAQQAPGQRHPQNMYQNRPSQSFPTNSNSTYNPQNPQYQGPSYQ